MNANVQTLRDFSLSFQDLYVDNRVVRTNLINDLEELVRNESKCLIVEGIEGIGKTNLLLQFSELHKFDCFTYFFNPACQFTAKQDYFMDDIGRQIYFYTKSEQPDPDFDFTEGNFNKVVFDLLRDPRRKNTPVYFVLDGLDQLDKTSLESIKIVLNQLPWVTNNFYFIVSGDRDKIREVIPDAAFKKSKSTRISRFTFEEAQQLFLGISDASVENVKEIYNTWKGHPERLSQIRRIIDKSLSLEAFIVRDDLQEKNDLLDEEWSHSVISELSFSDDIFKLVCVLAFDDNVRNIPKIKDILAIDDDSFIDKIHQISFLMMKGDDVYFVSHSMQKYVVNKLKKYESDITSLLITYYAKHDSLESVLSLSSLYERKREWNSVLQLLSLDNLNLIISNSNSFADIRKQINHGFTASNNLKNSYGNLLKFSLYRSSLSSFQKSDIRESLLQAYASLGKSEEAYSLISNAVIREDRLRMLIYYAKELSLKKEKVDEVIVDEIRDLIKSVDIEYVSGHIIDIVLGLAHILPEEAVLLVEKVSGVKASNGSLEWLLGYVAMIISKDKQKQNSSALKVEGKVYSANDFIEKFAKSIGFGVSDVQAKDVRQYIASIENLSDRIYLLRRWIQYNKKSENIYDIMNYALDLLLEDASKTKPTTTILLDIISPIKFLDKEAMVFAMIDRIDKLTVSITNPTSDRIKMNKLIIETIYCFDIDKANDRAFKLYKVIDDMDDYSIKIESLSYLLNMVVNIAGDKKYKDSHFVLDVEFVKDRINESVDRLLGSVAEQYEELEDAIGAIAKFDIRYAVNLAERLNTQRRRSAALLLALSMYVGRNIKNWEVGEIKSLISKIGSPSTYNKAVLEVFQAAIEQKNQSALYRNKIKDLLFLIEKIDDNGLKCYLISKAITLLNTYPENGSVIVAKYDSLTFKLNGFLTKFYNKIDTSWHKVEVGYRLAAELSSTNKDLAVNYFEVADQISSENLVNNDVHAAIIVSSVRLLIRAFCGVLKSEPTCSYSKVGAVISQIPSAIVQVSLWAELATRAYIVGASDITRDVVAQRLLPQLIKYKDGKDYVYFSTIFKLIASAVYLVEPDSLLLYMNDFSKEDVDEAVSSICYVLLTNCHETDPYDDKKGSVLFKYQRAKQYIDVLKQLDDDSALYFHISNMCDVARAYPLNFTRDQKSDIYSKLQDLISSKLPNPTSGVKHDGFVIVAKAAALQFSNESQQVVSSMFEQLYAQTELINNDSDRSYIFSLLANECGKKKKVEYLTRAFVEADKIVSTREKITSYRNALGSAWKISPEMFSHKMRQIHLEVYKLDESSMFPTYQKLIDLAYKYDKSLAQRLITDLDTDPARQHIAEPASKHLSKLENESKALSDYTKINAIKSRENISEVVWTMLAQLNAGVRNSRDITQTVSILTKASRTSLQYSMPLYEFFMHNALKDDVDEKALSLFYESALSNVKLCYNIISLLLEKNAKTLVDGTNNAQSTFSAKPGLRKEAIQFIGNYIKESSSKEVYIIDPYFSEKDVDFIKSITQWVPGAYISVLTSCEAGGDFTKYSFLNSWLNISAEEFPQSEFVSVSTQYKKSPVHDRWILLYDKMQGINIGTSFNSLGLTKFSKIAIMYSDDVKKTYGDVVVPFVKNRVREYESFVINYEGFSL